MNFENSKNFESHRLLLNFADKINIKIYQILACTTHGKNIKKSCKNNEFKISVPIWSNKFDIPDGSKSASDI